VHTDRSRLVLETMKGAPPYHMVDSIDWPVVEMLDPASGDGRGGRGCDGHGE